MEHSAAEANPAHDPVDAAKEDLAYVTGVQAYVYGYATVELYRTFHEQTQDPERGHSVGVNEFNHIRRLTTPDDAWVVTPNNDTLYSRAWLDLSEEPIILEIPDIAGVNPTVCWSSAVPTEPTSTCSASSRSGSTKPW